MIINASARTDIPAFYMPWFMNRIEEGYVFVKNPFNEMQIHRIPLTKDVVDAIIFTTKNPIPLVFYLDILRERGYAFGCQVTITPYQKEIESYVPNKNKVIRAFKEISKRIGNEKMIWRYDPICVTTNYTVEYHISIFEQMCKSLSGYTKTIIISFVDSYPNMIVKHRELTQIEMETITKAFVLSAKRYGMVIQTCAEKVDLEKFGAVNTGCISLNWVEAVVGEKLEVPKGGTRALCHCIQSIDIGSYNSCLHGCTYCYACNSMNKVQMNRQLHNSKGEILIGKVAEGAIIKERKVVSYKQKQLQFDI